MAVQERVRSGSWLCRGDENDFLIPLSLFFTMEMGYVAHGSVFSSFALPFPPLYSWNFVFVVVAFLSPLVRLYMGSPAMDGELGPFNWGFWSLFFSLLLSLSLCRPCPSTCLLFYGNA